jgi:death-on-curing protein
MKYLKASHIIFFNEDIITTDTPEEILGVREPGALEMLVNAPKETLFGEELYPTIFDKAAILMINIATKHVFHNANKRTAFISLDVFMNINGYESNFEYEEGINFVLWVVREHEKTEDFEGFKKSVASKIEEKYKKINA